jgi:RNA polymerase-binding transcription factor DksA
VPPKWKWHHDRLIQLLEKLCGAQRGHLRDAAQTKPNFSMSMADGATDEFDRDLLLSEASSEQDVIYEIEQALKRIENGSYGICEVTGEAISKARLRTIPWTRFSQRAEIDLERKGTVRAAHLGELGSARPAGEMQPAAELKQPEEEESV